LRLIITLCCLAALNAASAETIVLKSGRRIVVDSVQERNGRVEYTIGDNTMTIPKSIVDHVEAGGLPASAVAQSRRDDPPPPVISERLPARAELIARVIHNDQVDISALRAIGNEGSANEAATAYAVAAGFAERHNDLESAARYLESALKFLPNHAVLLENYASLLLQLGRAEEALSAAERSARANPQSAAAFALLGYACYKDDRSRDAIAAWKRSLALVPDPRVQQLLDRAEREAETEADFRQQESNHFTLRYEGGQAPEALRSQILDTLENDYGDLSSDLGAAPKNIFVSLYTDQAFFDVTQAPAWTSALNDGKIRIPISGLDSVTPELARVLRHELTHSFVQNITHGRVPQWLNEGIAQLEEGMSTSAFGPRLASLYTSGHQVPLSQLEGNFSGFGSGEAEVAYAEGLAATEYIRATYGMSDLARILARIGEGQSVEAALRSTIHSGYAELESEITGYLKKAYGA
jgi:tetratricopeptide (TPR) repeat protein